MIVLAWQESKRQNNWWTFWGSFSACRRVEYLFWERYWGQVSANSYIEHILPRVVHWISRNLGTDSRSIRFIQDNTPPYKVASSLAYLRSHEIKPFSWPELSPDINRIEAVWSLMKSYLNARFPETGQGRWRRRVQVREIVEEAWKSVTPD